jgi:phage terminase large subunit
MTNSIEVDVGISVFLPCYRHVLDDTRDIEILYGGRDSGKSRHIAQQLLLDCLSNDYFRCILAKKTFESIKDAQWQTLKDVAEDWGIAHLFTFNVSPLAITCLNGNKFIARGFDKADKVKSISNPSHAWIEEADQLTQSDYITLVTTLRRNDGKRVVQFLSLNPETKGDKEDFWVYKMFFKDVTDKSFSSQYTLKDNKGVEHVYRYRATHTTYHDNPYCTPDRQATLESLAATDPYYYQVYTLGEWGQKQAIRPFITALRPEHIGRCEYDPTLPVFVSMDFNIDPFAFIFAHATPNKLHIFNEATIWGGSIEKAADYIKDNYAQSIHRMMFTGDPGGNRREISQRDNASLYKTLMSKLNLRPNQVVVPAAPRHKNSREECNYFLHHFPEVIIDERHAKQLIFDMKTVEVDSEGSIIKRNRKDDAQRADHLDGFRYLCHTFYLNWINTHQKQGSRINPKK